MKYCMHCGALLAEDSAFCARCGQSAERFPEMKESPSSHVDALDKLGCELAYFGTLFWIPLLLCPNSRNAKYHANQGLWLLILSVLACTVVRILSAINSFFAGSILGAFSGAIYALAFTVFLFVMFYLSANALVRILAIHRGEQAKSILFFDSLRIIKE